MTPRVVAKSGMLVRLDSSASRMEPTPMPPRATPMGRPMASTEPNATIRMTMANARPNSSDDGGSNSLNMLPPYSTRTPSMPGCRSRTELPNSMAASWSSSPATSTLA